MLSFQFYDEKHRTLERKENAPIQFEVGCSNRDDMAAAPATYMQLDAK